MRIKKALAEKIREAARSVLPIAAIVAAICFLAVPVAPSLMLSFLAGTGLLVFGMAVFTAGVELSMTQIGSYTGSRMTKSRKLWLVLAVSFLLGIAITVAEPDLQVLAGNVPHIETPVLVLSVSAGTGLFLMASMLRILLGIPLKWMLTICYAAVFLLAALSRQDFLSVAFDSGGVTTGPMTVPFIMAIGAGVSSIRSDQNAEADSFGLVALCSIGPILAVLVLGFLYGGQNTASYDVSTVQYSDTIQLSRGYLNTLTTCLHEMALALAPVVVFFLAFQIFSLKLHCTPFLRILNGLGCTYAGLVLFLTGVNAGFAPLGAVLGGELASGRTRFLLVPLSMLMGWFIIRAEPAVHTLEHQVEEVSSGAISSRSLRLSLSVAIAAANGLAMVRVLTGLNILRILLPGYSVALALSFFVPPVFTAIAFDSGGVASGPMTAAFMLPFAAGACQASGGNVFTDAFGLIALVAMTPLITVQVLGAVCVFRTGKTPAESAAAGFTDDEIIELWEERPAWN